MKNKQFIYACPKKIITAFFNQPKKAYYDGFLNTIEGPQNFEDTMHIMSWFITKSMVWSNTKENHNHWEDTYKELYALDEKNVDYMGQLYSFPKSLVAKFFDQPIGGLCRRTAEFRSDAANLRARSVDWRFAWRNTNEGMLFWENIFRGANRESIS